MPMDDTIELGSDTDSDIQARWDPSDWIGRGLAYPANDTPAVVLAGRRLALAIPSRYEGLLPHPELSIDAFLEAHLPTQRSGLVSSTSMELFSKDAPNEDLAKIVHRPIPPSRVLKTLQQTFGQAWFDGARSVVDPYYKRSRLPLYAVSYWLELDRAIVKRAEWEACDQWLQKKSYPGSRHG
ncbi:hypothetical protein NUW54_g11171 [Trametes sanguinea]|uniref:Uncharacterized protein n=1 Tax=Trametes sanguinea TaxID=158606 RepID=A0ACC1NL31_9APHY|nr:hypothetical protein NUW54_g11171 [Trametes sanguinea]